MGMMIAVMMQPGGGRGHDEEEPQQNWEPLCP